AARQLRIARARSTPTGPQGARYSLPERDSAGGGVIPKEYRTKPPSHDWSLRSETSPGLRPPAPPPPAPRARQHTNPRRPRPPAPRPGVASEHEPEARIDRGALRTSRRGDRQGVGAAVLPREPHPAAGRRVPAVGRLTRDPDSPRIREPEDADVAHRQAPDEQPQLGVPVGSLAPGEPLLGVAADRRLAAHVYELVKGDGATHRRAARAERERRGGRVARREVG